MSSHIVWDFISQYSKEVEQETEVTKQHRFKTVFHLLHMWESNACSGGTRLELGGLRGFGREAVGSDQRAWQPQRLTSLLRFERGHQLRKEIARTGWST